VNKPTESSLPRSNVFYWFGSALTRIMNEILARDAAIVRRGVCVVGGRPTANSCSTNSAHDTDPFVY